MFKLIKPHNWLIYSIVNPELKKMIKNYAKGKLIDIGCGQKPYMDMASPYIEEHIGIDYKESMHDSSDADFHGTAYNIPFDMGVFDTVMCTYVLEHLEEPSSAIAEAFRVLKPGGYAIYTVPLFWHLHEEPRDFFRYTKHGLAYLFKKNGFEIIKIKALSGFAVTFCQELVYFLYGLRKGGVINPLWWIVPPIGLIIQVIGYIFNKIEHTEKFTTEYLAVVKKPSYKQNEE